MPEAPRPAATLEVRGLHKRFGRKEVVKAVDFDMTNNKIIGLFGPNGAGKTTIFHIIVGFIRPDCGTVELIENDITNDITKLPMYKRARQGIAYLPQEPSVFRRLTVRQNVLAALEIRRMPRGQTHDLCDELLAKLGIKDIAAQKAHTLSGGERRRTEIARALATDPRFILLDEPFAGIDPISVYQIKDILRSLVKSRIGILLTDHNVHTALDITEHSLIIQGGSILTEGRPEVIAKDPRARETYLGQDFPLARGSD